MRTFIYLLFAVALAGCVPVQPLKQPVTSSQPSVSVVTPDKPATPATTKKIIHISDNTHFVCETEKEKTELCKNIDDFIRHLSKLSVNIISIS